MHPTNPLHVDSNCGGKAEAALRKKKKNNKQPASFFLYNCRLLPFFILFLFTFFFSFSHSNLGSKEGT